MNMGEGSSESLKENNGQNLSICIGEIPRFFYV